jgi:transglutaminase-like putative cysteine protease
MSTQTATRPTSSTPADNYSSTRRTLRALLASALGVLPLCELFTDVRWLFEIWLAMAIAVAPAALLRRWRRPKVLHTWIGLALVVLWLTARYVPHHALGGVLPTFATWHDVSKLMSSVHDTTSTGVAPVHTTLAIKFVLAAMLALLAALVDLIAVVGRRGALAGVPLLVVYTVSGAVPRHPVSWVLFLGAAAGFLLLLSIDADDEVRGWGRLIPRAGESRPTAGLGVSGPRIAAIALVAAVLLPLVAPARPANLIADLFHNGKGSGGGEGGGFGASSGVSLDPFDALKGDLQRTKAVKLFSVTLGSKPAAAPFYLRANVLMGYSDRGWSAFRHGGTENIGSTFFATSPPTSTISSTVNFTARLHVLGLADNPPVFGKPVAVTGVDGEAEWSRNDQLLLGPKVHNGQDITQQIAQPAPSRADLESAPDDVPTDVTPALQVPATMPKFVADLVQRITGGLSTPYAKARALSDYFTDTASGFSYSLTTKSGDSGSDLVDFLTNKAGYCQQYAAAMGIMLRMAGVPARVVLGYTHAAADQSGTFTVTTNDAHAWVEAYFSGVGWIPFDPTPLAGVNGGAQANLPWAPHPSNGTTGGVDVPTISTSTRPGGGATAVTSEAAGSGAGRSGVTGITGIIAWVLVPLLVLALLLLIPAATRWRRRRRRLRAAGRGDPDPLWAELSDTAVDLGYVWSPARSPRQVAGWLGRQVDAPARESLSTLATAVELARYAPPQPGATTSLVGELRTVEARLRSERSRSVRIGARLLPASLGWRRFRLAMPRRKRH